jgi:mono/diheme cytochrome c family protein
MNGFDLPEPDALAVTQYIKTFSIRWKTGTVGEPVPQPPDPWAEGQRTAAIGRGRIVYHTQARCWQCHPAYASRDGILDMMRAAAAEQGGQPPSRVGGRRDLGQSVMVQTGYGPIQAPDFRKRTFRAGRSGAAIYRTMAAGIGGTPMQSYYEQLGPRDIWAVVHYVREINRLKRAP